MKWDEYRRAVDAVEFSPDFTARTLSLLEARRKEPSNMKKLSIKTVLIAAALVAVLAVTAGAAAMLLSPAQVARQGGYDLLAAAFEQGEATLIDQTQTVGGYDVTLMGFASGKDLARAGDSWDSLSAGMTYLVAAVTGTDGAPIAEDVPAITLTPVVEGYAPWQVNNWTLGGGYTAFLDQGVLYAVFESGSVEPFADHRVMLAVYPGYAKTPSSEIFAFDAQTGAIAYQPGQEGVFFHLPLGPDKADPAQVDALLGDLPDPSSPEAIASSDMNVIEFNTTRTDNGETVLTAVPHS